MYLFLGMVDAGKFAYSQGTGASEQNIDNLLRTKFRPGERGIFVQIQINIIFINGH